MRQYYHIITNFPDQTPLWKKIISNLVFLFSITRITLRGSLLNNHDYKQAKKLLQKGDALLVGQHKRLSKYFIQGPVTHAMMCVGKYRMVHAMADGVISTSLKRIIKEYDTLVIIRPKVSADARKKIIEKAIDFCQDQIGKPFDFFFGKDTEKFYCSQLVNEAYHYAGFDTGLTNHKKFDHEIINKLIKIQQPLHPADFLNDRFEIVYMSENLSKDGSGKIIFDINLR